MAFEAARVVARKRLVLTHDMGRIVMDPDVALENMREMIEKLRDRVCRHGDPHFVLEPTVEAWEALDGWLSKGGFRPMDWKP